MKPFYIYPIFLFFLLSSCSTLPKDKHEFRTLSKERNGVTKVTVNAPLDVVVTKLKNHINKCISVHKTTSRTERGIPVSRMDEFQFAKWEKNSAGNFIVSTIIDSPQTINQPKGGQIFHITELSAKGKNTSVVLFDLNVPWGIYDFTTEYKNALLGKPGTCQHAEARD